MVRPKKNFLNQSLLEEWDYDKNEQSPTISLNSSKAWWIGKECGHQWEALISNRLKGVGCPVCAGKLIVSGENDLESRHPKIAKEWSSKNTASPSEVSWCSGKKFWWNGDCGHEWEALVSNRVRRGDKCPICYTPSNLERIVFIALRGLYDGDILRNRKPLHYGDKKLELDFYLPKLSLAFEVQDFATHSKTSDGLPGRFRSVPIIKNGPSYHELKRRLAKDQLSCRLVDLWEDVVKNDANLKATLKKYL